MTVVIYLIILIAIAPFLYQAWIGVGLLLSRVAVLTFVFVAVVALTLRVFTKILLSVIPNQESPLFAVVHTVHLISAWPTQSLREFLREYRQLETLTTVKQGMKDLRIKSLFEYYWRRDVLTLRSPSLLSTWQRPVIFVPGIPANAFYPADLYPWIIDGMALIPEFKSEVTALLEHQSAFLPYHNEFGLPTHPFVKPENQSVKKYEKNDWNMFFFYRGGREISENHAACPVTSSFLKRIPHLEKTMVCFSALRPGVWVPPHYGLTNAIVRVHLPLEAPPHCAIRVGAETREWQAGVPLLFDDSFQHEVWNRSSETRIVLFINAFHPLLSPYERETLAHFLNVSFGRSPAVSAWRELTPKHNHLTKAKQVMPAKVS